LVAELMFSLIGDRGFLLKLLLGAQREVVVLAQVPSQTVSPFCGLIRYGLHLLTRWLQGVRLDPLADSQDRNRRYGSVFEAGSLAAVRVFCR